MKLAPLLAFGLFAVSTVCQAEDSRQFVELPEMMHSMRGHLLALQTITRQLSDGEYDAAADTAEHRLGMSSLENHGAAHMAPYMPKGMQDAGTAMHPPPAASRSPRVMPRSRAASARPLARCRRSWPPAWPAIQVTGFTEIGPLSLLGLQLLEHIGLDLLDLEETAHLLVQQVIEFLTEHAYLNL